MYVLLSSLLLLFFFFQLFQDVYHNFTPAYEHYALQRYAAIVCNDIVGHETLLCQTLPHPAVCYNDGVDNGGKHIIYMCYVLYVDRTMRPWRCCAQNPNYQVRTLKSTDIYIDI